MNTGKLAFAQVMSHLPLTIFRRCVRRRGQVYIRSIDNRQAAGKSAIDGKSGMGADPTFPLVSKNSLDRVGRGGRILRS